MENCNCEKESEKDRDARLTEAWKQHLINESMKAFLRKNPDGKPPELEATQPQKGKTMNKRIGWAYHPEVRI